jgi:uncharacterized protein YodC (DUF2158 family)
MSDDIKVGDVVQLRSGGPVMTVGSRGGNNHAYVGCVWFDGSNVKEHGFSVELLRLVPEKKQ